jgi:non-specific serine/threonine protein kinase
MSDEPNSSPGDQEQTGSLVAFPRERAAERPPHNLPLELTSFIGRENELAEVRGLLGGDARLVTLCGPGGCGKTRLALAVAREMVEAFEGGVWWVELASISDSELVPGAVAQALGVREMPDRPLTEVLVAYLEPRKTLLVLDNCEHLVEECAALAYVLLRSCPDLKILTTSREPLRIAGESSWTVPNLSLPDPQSLPPTGELGRYEAIRLFVERAKTVDTGFALTEQRASAVARLCSRLDGIPLAIELAAARARVLTVEQILKKLEDPLALLTTGSRMAPPRHQTLRAALQWSYDLLDEQERELFGRLSVFAGGWDLEAAEAVGAGGSVLPGMVLDLLSNLVDKSLVVAEKSGEGEGSYVRYRMLEPVRQFAREKLQERPEEPEARRRHAEHYLVFAERAEPELLGADQAEWLGRLRTEIGNLRGTFSWSLEPGDGEDERAGLGLRLAAALGRFWDVQDLQEGKRWLLTALERDPGGFPAVRARALGGLGWILIFQQYYGPAIEALEEAIPLHKELGDETGAASALAILGHAALHGRYRERMRNFVEEAEALMRGELDDDVRALMSLVTASAAMEEGDYELAVARLEENLALCRELGNLQDTPQYLFPLGMLELSRGNLDRGAAMVEESARITRGLGDRLGDAYWVWGLGKVAAMWGKPVRAARLWGAAEALREQLGMSLSPFDLDQSGYEQDLAAVISALSEAAFEAAWAEGRAMSHEQAIEYALAEVEEPATEPATMTTANPVAAEPRATASEMPAQTASAEARPTAAADLRIFALGRARVERGEQPLAPSDFGYAKPRELLFYLLSYPEGRTKGQIGLALWPEASPSQLRGVLHEALRRLRQALGGSERIVHRGGRYAFERSLDYSFDVEAFEAELAAARGSEGEAPERAIAHLEEAVGLYGGEYLEDWLEWEWATERREELGRRHQQALLSLGGLLLEDGRHERAAEAYHKAIVQDGYLEGAHRGLMRSYALMGERGRALEHYRSLVGVLEEGLGTAPAPETRALYEELRRGEQETR